MSDIKVGDIRAVSGGYGLMRVVEYDEKSTAVGMIGHGPQKIVICHWFHTTRLGKLVGKAEVKMEWEQANARRVACNNPDCWCVEYRK